MGYLGLDVDNLVRELKLLMENNYGKEVNKNNRETLFNYAKRDILESFIDTIEQNKEEVFKDLEEENEE